MVNLKTTTDPPRGSVVYLHDPLHDPLQDTRILRMLRLFYGRGPASMFPPEVEGNEELKHLDGAKAKLLGLCSPVRAIRAPTSIHTAQLESHVTCRSMQDRIADMVVGCWLSDTPCDGALVKKYVPLNPGLAPEISHATILREMTRAGRIVRRRDGALQPSRALLYRAIESIAWLLDTLGPIAAEFADDTFAAKFDRWPDIANGVHPCSS